MRDSEFTVRLRSGAAELAAAVNPPPPDAIRRQGDRRRQRTIAMSGVLAFAVGVGGGGAAYASLGQAGQGSSEAASGSVPISSAVATSSSAPVPGIVAVTTGGTVEVLSPVTGVAARILVPKADAIGDEVSISPSGSTVYFAVKSDCTDHIESVPVTGGTPTEVTTGVLPAVSPDGRELAFVREPFGGGPSPVRYGCSGPGTSSADKFEVVVRDLETGSEKVYPAGGAPMGFPISHLSWAPSGATILVSVGPAQRNTGWFLSVLNVATSRSYLPANWYSYLPLNQSAADVLAVPVTGKPDAARSYYREGVYLPDGNMFVDRMCCAGVPGTVTSTLLQEVSASGRLIRQVAMGFNDRDHTSLDASGGLLLYLSAHDLYVSDSGRPASKLTTGLIAAAWLPS